MAIQVNGTTVIDNSRQLTNIASVDSATATALNNAGVGGGVISFSSSSVSSSSTFTKPNDAYSLQNYFFTQLNKQFTGSPSTSYKALTGSTASVTGIVELTFTVQNPDTYSLRSGGYWGDDIMVGIENTTSNYSMAFANIAAGWTSQTSFPTSHNTGLMVLNQNERPCVWISDVYTGGGQFNSNLVLGSGDIVITTRSLVIT